MTDLTPRRRKKPVKLTKERQARALALLESGEFICDVADQIGVTRQALFELKKRDEAFAKAWGMAEEIGMEVQATETEREMDVRGRLGYLVPKFYEGRICGFEQKYSDALLLARAKALMPEKYGDKTKIDGTLNVGGLLVIGGSSKTAEEWHAKHTKTDNE